MSDTGWVCLFGQAEYRTWVRAWNGLLLTVCHRPCSASDPRPWTWKVYGEELGFVATERGAKVKAIKAARVVFEEATP